MLLCVRILAVQQQHKRRRITLDFDKPLLEAVDQEAHESHTSRSQFITHAVREALRIRERQRIDAAFEEMAKDPIYQQQLIEINQQLSAGSDDAWQWMGTDVHDREPSR